MRRIELVGCYNKKYYRKCKCKVRGRNGYRVCLWLFGFLFVVVVFNCKNEYILLKFYVNFMNKGNVF